MLLAIAVIGNLCIQTLNSRYCDFGNSEVYNKRVSFRRTTLWLFIQLQYKRSIPLGEKQLHFRMSVGFSRYMVGYPASAHLDDSAYRNTASS